MLTTFLLLPQHPCVGSLALSTCSSARDIKVPLRHRLLQSSPATDIVVFEASVTQQAFESVLLNGDLFPSLPKVPATLKGTLGKTTELTRCHLYITLVSIPPRSVTRICWDPGFSLNFSTYTHGTGHGSF